MSEPAVNRVLLTGRVRSLDVTARPDGRLRAAMHVTATESWTDADGRPVTHDVTHHVVAWGRWAEVARDYLHAGAHVLVEGRLHYREWQSGALRRRDAEVQAERIIALGR